MYIKKNTESTICTSEYTTTVYISITQKIKTLSTKLQVKRKVTARYISRILNKQGNCMRLWVTHQLITTSGSYRSIKTMIFQQQYKKLMRITKSGSRVYHI